MVVGHLGGVVPVLETHGGVEPGAAGPHGRGVSRRVASSASTSSTNSACAGERLLVRARRSGAWDAPPAEPAQALRVGLSIGVDLPGRWYVPDNPHVSYREVGPPASTTN